MLLLKVIARELAPLMQQPVHRMESGPLPPRLPRTSPPPALTLFLTPPVLPLIPILP